MERTKRQSDRHRRMTCGLFAGFVLVCVLIGLLCFLYYGQLQATVKTEADGYLREISKQIGVNVSKTVQDNYAVMNTVAAVLKQAEVTTYEALQPILLEQQVNWHYRSLALIDESGTAYNAEGKVAMLLGEEYLQEAVVERRPAMSGAQILDGHECIVFAVPLEGVAIEGRAMRAMVASYDLTTFDRVLSMSAFEGRSYAHIIKRDGTVVVRSSAESAPETGYNLLNSMESAKTLGAKTLEEMRGDIAQGASGQIELRQNGAADYITYTPLDIEQWYLLTFVPVAVVNAKSQLLLQSTILVCSLVTVAFTLLLAGFGLSFYRHRRRLEQMAYVDPVTGGNSMQRFYELAEERLGEQSRGNYALIYVNIDKFKILNEQLGRSTCDRVLESIEHGIGETLRPTECMGRLFADNFCVLADYEDKETLLARFEVWQSACGRYFEKNSNLWLPLIIEFGIFVIGEKAIPLPPIIDRAKLALRNAARETRGKFRYAFYDEGLRDQLVREKQLEDRMEESLAGGEFQVYLQPKYRISDEKIGGAEALVRWQSKAEGMIYPNEFIPLFEKNGFVVKLDTWVMEAVCRRLRAWLDAGYEPVTVSVNCSRLHLRNRDFLQEYGAICRRYKIPPHLIEIELTESVVFEDVEHLIRTIAEIHQAGFTCSMDDFGSGYSSLSMIRDIHVDVLKLDRIFFNSSSADRGRTGSVVGSIITMARALSMKTVAEGVEEQHQVEMLKELGCDYIQGFYYARPMPFEEFECLAFGKQL